MTKYTANLMLVSLKLEDMPLRYNPPVGPPVEFKVTYNQRDPYSQAFPNYSNLGAQWSCDWFTYIEDEGQVWSDYYAHRPSIPGIGSNVQRFVSGGGLMNYTLTNASTGLFMPDRDGNILQFNLTNNTLAQTVPFLNIFALPVRLLLHNRVDFICTQSLIRLAMRSFSLTTAWAVFIKSTTPSARQPRFIMVCRKILTR
jgi:hypothetical protein